MRSPLLCVGGPLQGQTRVLAPGQRGFVLNAAPEMAFFHEFMPSASAAIMVEEQVYRVEKLAMGGPGFNIQIEVLAYYGGSKKDRPAGFYL